MPVEEYRLDLWRKEPDGTWKQLLMERFDAPFTTDVLSMVCHETGYGQSSVDAITPCERMRIE